MQDNHIPMRCQRALLLAAVLAAAAALPAAAAPHPSQRKLSQARAPRVKKVEWRVPLGVVAPDCFERPAILVNGQLGPTLEVTQGDFLEVCCAKLCRAVLCCAVLC
jgi:FtsP/CotA-like multicopper oxidase with cupredoxin domain